MSEPHRLQCGVRQGGVSLSNLYMNELTVELSSQHVGCHIDGVAVNNLDYANDVVLLSDSVCDFRSQISILQSYAG